MGQDKKYNDSTISTKSIVIYIVVGLQGGIMLLGISLGSYMTS